MPPMHRGKAASPVEYEDRIVRRSALRAGTEWLTQRVRVAELDRSGSGTLAFASASLVRGQVEASVPEPSPQSLYPQMELRDTHMGTTHPPTFTQGMLFTPPGFPQQGFSHTHTVTHPALPQQPEAVLCWASDLPFRVLFLLSPLQLPILSAGEGGDENEYSLSVYRYHLT